MSTTAFVLSLFLVVLGPLVAILVLGLRFRKLSYVAGLTGQARQRRLAWLAVLASALTGSFYLIGARRVRRTARGARPRPQQLALATRTPPDDRVAR